LRGFDKLARGCWKIVLKRAAHVLRFPKRWPSLRQFLLAYVLLGIQLSSSAYSAEDFSACATELDAPADEPKFEISEYQVEGNSVLPTLAIERAVYPYLGPGKGTLDIRAACAALGRAYQKAGYLTVVVDIPNQRVDDGIVQLRVTEGKVANVSVKGNRYYSRGVIRDRTPALAQGQVPNFPEVQQQLAQLSRTPDRQVTPLLRPGPTPGTVDVDLNVEDRLPLHGSAELNNRQSPNTTPLRFVANISYDNLWQREHSIGLTVQTAPQEPFVPEVTSARPVLRP